MNSRRSPLLRKDIKSFENVGKNYHSCIDYGKYMIGIKKDKCVHITCLSCHNVLTQREEICLKPIGIAVSHYSTFSLYFVT